MLDGTAGLPSPGHSMSGRERSERVNMRRRDRDSGGRIRGDRGQTLHDYVLGIGLFALVVVGLLTALLPTMFAPFEDTVGGDKRAQADRIADQLVANTTVPGESNRVNATEIEHVVSADQEGLRDRFTLPKSSRINITVSTMNESGVVTSASGTTLATADGPGDNPAATSARVVTLSDDSCPTACRLVVRVW